MSFLYYRIDSTIINFELPNVAQSKATGELKKFIETRGTYMPTFMYRKPRKKKTSVTPLKFNLKDIGMQVNQLICLILQIFFIFLIIIFRIILECR